MLPLLSVVTKENCAVGFQRFSELLHEPGVTFID